MPALGCINNVEGFSWKKKWTHSHWNDLVDLSECWFKCLLCKQESVKCGSGRQMTHIDSAWTFTIRHTSIWMKNTNTTSTYRQGSSKDCDWSWLRSSHQRHCAEWAAVAIHHINPMCIPPSAGVFMYWSSNFKPLRAFMVFFVNIVSSSDGNIERRSQLENVVASACLTFFFLPKGIKLFFRLTIYIDVRVFI